MTDANARQRLLVTPAGVPLCRLDVLPDPGARNFVVKVGEAFFHGFVVRAGDVVRGYVDRCPHAGLPLARRLDDYLSPDGTLIACAWHGALFDLLDGACRAGPCIGQRLTPWPVVVEAGTVKTA